MIIIRLKGGMGNQMFQYALGVQLAEQLGTELKIDLSSLLDRSKGDFVYRNYDLPIFEVNDNLLMSEGFLKTIYKPKISRITKWLRQYIDKSRSVIKEQQFHFDANLITQPKDNTIYEGWFQSYKYFEGVADKIKKEFRFKDSILESSKPLLERIKSSNAICLNVRRTDFLKVDNLNTTDKNYFFKAAHYLAGRVEQPRFFIFSDDG